MVRTILKTSFVVMLVMSSLSLMAQVQAKEAKADVKKQVEALDLKLDLSADQVQKITAILVKAEKAYKGLEGKEKMRAGAEVRADIKAVLNKEQVKKYEQLNEGKTIMSQKKAKSIQPAEHPTMMKEQK